jgi:hypothetical protein
VPASGRCAHAAANSTWWRFIQKSLWNRRFATSATARNSGPDGADCGPIVTNAVMDAASKVVLSMIISGNKEARSSIRTVSARSKLDLLLQFTTSIGNCFPSAADTL